MLRNIIRYARNRVYETGLSLFSVVTYADFVVEALRLKLAMVGSRISLPPTSQIKFLNARNLSSIGPSRRFAVAPRCRIVVVQWISNSISLCLLRSSQYERGARTENSLAKHCMENALWRKTLTRTGRDFIQYNHYFVLSILAYYYSNTFTNIFIVF